ncbi:hypothetical protein B4168_3564 [Anoxybacillus flavithermus]|nr:hypothetical protein B4168_3564 [Anoxybacillus flavithermus]OAO87258.1 hypothetical protein GT23_1441 [Parageobacillus thermoglucosidasius]
MKIPSIERIDDGRKDKGKKEIVVDPPGFLHDWRSTTNGSPA